MQLRSKKDHRQKSSTRLTKRPMIKIVTKGVTKLNHGKCNTFQYILSIMKHKTINTKGDNFKFIFEQLQTMIGVTEICIKEEC
jgi:hypothetical protein